MNTKQLNKLTRAENKQILNWADIKTVLDKSSNWRMFWLAYNPINPTIDTLLIKAIAMVFRAP